MADERCIFSTLDISSTPGIIVKKYLLLMLGFIVIVTIICLCYFYCCVSRKCEELRKIGHRDIRCNKIASERCFFPEKKKLLKETKFINHFRHILRLLAVCLDGDSPLLVLEFMETDDLLKYLRDCRNLEASDSHALRLQDLLAMCKDVARGCCYLEV